jgi:hypothetical protein
MFFRKPRNRDQDDGELFCFLPGNIDFPASLQQCFVLRKTGVIAEAITLV